MLHHPGVGRGQAGICCSSGGQQPGGPARVGYNSYGQLGDGTFHLGTTPMKVKLRRGVKVTSVRAGCYVTLMDVVRPGCANRHKAA